MGDDIVKFSTESESLKNKMGSYDEKRFEKSKVRLLKQFDDDESANFFMSIMQKRLKKQY